MEFEELSYIKDRIKRIYDNEHYPRSKVIPSLNGPIGEERDQWFCNPPEYSAKVPFLQQVIEDLLKVKGLDNRKELFATYANFGKKLFDNDISNLESTRRLLKERLNELEKVYFMHTRPIMKFMVHDEIAEKIYLMDASNYDKLASLLCYMNLLGFEELLKQMDEAYKLFTSPQIGVKINEGQRTYDYELSPDYFIPTDSSYLLRKITGGKDVILKYNDIEYKLRAINGILNNGIFDYTKTEYKSVSTEAVINKVFKEELSSYIDTQSIDEPPKEKLEDWIKQIAKSISDNEKSDVSDSKTIELYLNFLVNNPLCTVNQIKKGIKKEGDVPDCDSEKLNDFVFNTFRGWENRFFEVLSDHCFNEYAQRFSRN